MAKVEEVKVNEIPDAEIEENENLLRLTKPYSFEGREIQVLDFKDFDNLKTDVMIEASDILTRSGRVVVNPEMDVQYCTYIASCATHLPLEFFDMLNLRDGVRVKNKVRNLFFGRE